ncbi:hypothetical protein EBU94_02320 [bacterium]|jgi:hypothetical protein|nr:hypothetical protein [bacterium]NBO36026.1 hypothetical protein [bacterium]
MRLINFSRNCLVSDVGLVYPLSSSIEDSEFVEKRLIIPFVGFSKENDFSSDFEGKLLLDADFDIFVHESNMFLVKTKLKKTRKKLIKKDEPKVDVLSFLLLYSAPYDPDSRFFAINGEKAPESVYSFIAGSENVNGLSYEMLIVLNMGVQYRFFYHSKVFSNFFCSMKVSSSFELELKWHKTDDVFFDEL